MVCLNKNQLLTHGNPLGFSALLSRLKPSAESYTGVIDSPDSVPCLFSQILHRTGDRSANLNFLVTDLTQNESGILELWDFLCQKAGEMGAQNVLVQLEETDTLIDTYRKAGFTAYGWEASWKFPPKINTMYVSESNWTIAGPTDDPHLRMLYQSLVPPIVQAAEAFPNEKTRRLVYRENKEIIAYLESDHGPAGIFLKPLIHPSTTDVTTLLSDLASQFTGLGQPVYLQVRSYQAWLLDTLQTVGGESSAHYTLLVKHLAVLQRNGVIITHRKLIENRHAEPTAPIVNHMVANDSPSPK